MRAQCKDSPFTGGDQEGAWSCIISMVLQVLALACVSAKDMGMQYHFAMSIYGFCIAQEDEMRLVRGVQASKRHQAEKQVEPKSHLQKYRRSSVQQEQKVQNS